MTLQQFVVEATTKLAHFAVATERARKADGSGAFPHIQDEEAWWDSFEAWRRLAVIVTEIQQRTPRPLR